MEKQGKLELSRKSNGTKNTLKKQTKKSDRGFPLSLF